MCDCVDVHVGVRVCVDASVCGSVETESMGVGVNPELGKERARGILIQRDGIRICRPLGGLPDSRARSPFSSLLMAT